MKDPPASGSLLFVGQQKAPAPEAKALRHISANRKDAAGLAPEVRPSRIFHPPQPPDGFLLLRRRHTRSLADACPAGHRTLAFAPGSPVYTPPVLIDPQTVTRVLDARQTARREETVMAKVYLVDAELRCIRFRIPSSSRNIRCTISFNTLAQSFGAESSQEIGRAHV